MTLTIGSLFSGYGGLDMAVETVTGGRTVWHCEYEPPTDKVPNPKQAGARLLAYRWPGVPNHGDVTAVDWAAVQPVDVLCGGSPCQDVSSAGKRAGMRAGTRSGLWASFVDAIATIRPRLVVWENVRGVLSAEADSALEPCPGCVGGGDDGPVLRALGRVLGDLAELGYDASWHGLRAADIGAPHGRFRVFVVAWPRADFDAVALGRGASGWDDGVRPAGLVAGAAADADDRTSDGERARTAPAGRSAVAATDAASVTRSLHHRDDCAAADPRGEHRQQRGVSAPGQATGGRPLGEPAGRRRAHAPSDADGSGLEVGGACGPRAERSFPVRAADAAADPDGDALRQQSVARTERRRPPVAGLAGANTAADSERGRRNGRSPQQVREPQQRAAVAWGGYEPAVRRWERLTRPAPLPWEQGARGGYRLAPRFSEWMMGLPAGHVTDVPGLTRNEQLKLIGNGVVPQQGAVGITRALEAAPVWVRAALAEAAAA